MRSIEVIRAQNAERARRYRERKKAQAPANTTRVAVQEVKAPTDEQVNQFDGLKNMVTDQRLYHYIGPASDFDNPNKLILDHCYCQKKNGEHPHVHQLIMATDKLQSAISNRHLTREDGDVKDHGLKRRFLKIECFQHALNVLHYLHCKKAQRKNHKHYRAYCLRVMPFGYLDACDGHCKRYRNKLAKSANFVHSSYCKVKGCVAMRDKARRSGFRASDIARGAVFKNK